MSYIGRGLEQVDNISKLDNITFDGSTTYALTKDSSAFTPISSNAILISVSGVIQQGNFSISGTNIVFNSAVAGTESCDFIMHYGTGVITTPSDGSVTNAKISDMAASKLTGTVAQANIADQAINEAKMQISNAPTNGYMLTAQSGNTGGLTWAEAPSGNLVLLQTTTLSSTTGNVDFNNVFDSTYKNYIVIGSQIRGDADSKIVSRFGTGSSPSYDSTSNYNRVVSYMTSTGSDGIKHSTTDTGVLVTPNTIDTSDGDASFVMYIPEPQNTNRRLQVHFSGSEYDTNPAVTFFNGSARCDNISFATAVTSIRFTPNAGSGFTTGTFKLYGVK